MIVELLHNRRSIRKFKSDPVDRSTVVELIEAASLAPSASNHQPWRFNVVESGNLIEKMAQEVEISQSIISQKIDPQYVEQFNQYGNYFTRFRHAPVVIIPTYKPIKILSNLINPGLDELTLCNIDKMEWNSGIVSASLAIQNLLLRVVELGLGASCMTGPVISLNKIKEMIDINDPWDIVCIIPVGYPAESPEPTPRKKPNSIIRWF